MYILETLSNALNYCVLCIGLLGEACDTSSCSIVVYAIPVAIDQPSRCVFLQGRFKEKN